jgi:hypothetical protein
VKTVQAALCVAAIALAGIILDAQSGVFFNEGWESGSAASSFNSNWYGQATQSQFSVQSAVRNGLFALQHRVTAGQDPGAVQYATQHFGDARSGPVWATGAGQHYYDLYIQYKVYYSAGFSFDTNYKQLIIGTEDDLNQTSACCNPWVAHYITIYVGPQGAQLAEGNNKQSASGQWMDFWPNANGYTNSNRLRLTSGRWYTIEVRRRLNDSGQNNGIFQMWVDGTMIADYRSVRMRVPRSGSFGTNMTYGTNFALISDYPFDGVSQNQSIYYDDVKFSTTYIGVGPGLPSAPTNLRIVRTP